MAYTSYAYYFFNTSFLLRIAYPCYALAFQGLGSKATLHQAVSGQERSQKRAFHFDKCRYRQGFEVC